MKVSVLLPTYNRVNMLPKAIESFLNQDYDNAELLILDDCSTDSTAEYLSQFANHEKIKVFIGTVNLAPPSNQNFLWDKATGDLVCQLHDDDQLTKDSLSKRVDLFNKEPSLQVVYGGAYLQNINGDSIGLFSGTPPDKNLILKHEYINFTTLMYRRDIGFKMHPELRYYFDWLFKIRCLNECVVGYTPEPVMFYTMHEGQESSIARATGVNPEQDRLMRIKLTEYGYR